MPFTLFSAGLLVTVAALGTSPGAATAVSGATPYLSTQTSSRRRGGYSKVTKAASPQAHPFWTRVSRETLYDDKRRVWDFFRDMDQDSVTYKHENIFGNMDIDGDNKLLWKEFRFAFSFQENPDEAAKEMWLKDDKDGDGVITFAEFDGFKGIGDSSNSIEFPEFVSFFRRNRCVGQLSRRTCWLVLCSTLPIVVGAWLLIACYHIVGADSWTSLAHSLSQR